MTDTAGMARDDRYRQVLFVMTGTAGMVRDDRYRQLLSARTGTAGIISNDRYRQVLIGSQRQRRLSGTVVRRRCGALSTMCVLF